MSHHDSCQRFGGMLNIAREGHGMLAIGGLSPRILVFGGYNIDDGNLKTIEAWDDVKETWTIAPYEMETPRGYFGLLATPSSTICNNHEV